MPLDVTDIQIFQDFHDSVKDDHRKCIPATIVKVHASRCTVDVVPAILNPLFDEFGNATFEQLPSLSDVPIGVMRGGGFLVWLPVQVGDSVLLIFSDLSTETWRAASAGTDPVKPGFVGKHTPAGPFAIPCVAPDVSIPSQPGMTSGDLIIGKDGADEQIHITASDIKLGRNASEFVALSNLVDAAVTTIVGAFNNHIHPVTNATPAGPGPVVTSTPAVPISPAPSSTAATLAKAE